jgi:membrane associated rhomboid family serine protease
MEQEPTPPGSQPGTGWRHPSGPPPAEPVAWRRPSRLAAVAEAPVSAALVAINVAVLAALSWRFDDPTGTAALVAAGALERGLIGAGQWWRLLTAVFLHVGWIHLLANSIFGFGWCRMVELIFGRRRFLALYLLAGVGASAASMAFHDAVGAGASGALFGMIGATLVSHRRMLPGWRPFLRSPSTISVATQLAVWTVLALSADLPIDHAAHFGGLAAGAGAAWTMTRPVPRRAGDWAPFALAFGAVLAMALWPRPGLSRFGAEEAVQGALAALDRDDVAGAERQLARLDAAGIQADPVELVRAVVSLEHDDLAAAARISERLLDETRVAPIRLAARSVLAEVGYRTYRGQGVPADLERGARYIQRACQAGLEEACRAEKAIRSGAEPVAPGPPGR